MNNSRTTVWVLTDDRPGHQGQVLGLAQRLGIYFEVKPLSFNCLAALPAKMQRPSFLTLTRSCAKSLRGPGPDLVISAGRRTAPIARAIKRRNAGKTRLVHIMNPQAGHEEFDFLVMPEHDKRAIRGNSVVTVGALHRLTHDALSEAAAKWKPVFQSLPEPRIAMIVGGTTKAGTFTTQDAGALADKANQMVQQAGGSLLITTSRRTGKEQTDSLCQSLSVPYYLHRWKAGGEEENPYLGLLALADAIIVTGDSISMLSEACFTGVPVYVQDVGNYIPAKHRRFHSQMYEERLARPLDGHLSPHEYVPLDEAGKVAALLKEAFPELWRR